MKISVVTGAGGVLCSEFAAALAKKGYAVMLLDINSEAAERIASAITADGGIAAAYRADVLDREMLESVKTRINDEYGSVSLLINGAGGNSPRCTTDKEYYQQGDIEDEKVRSFFKLDRDGFEFVFGLNCLGTVIPTQVFAVDMYSAAKSAVSNLTQWMAVHFAPASIRVNAIAPGFFATSQNRSLLFNEDGSATARTEKILRATPMGRLGIPSELIGTLLWLIDDEASGFVTGITVPVDGGFSAYSGV